MSENIPIPELPPLAERRAGRRRRVLLAGVITVGRGLPGFDCAIRDLSQSGARVSPGQFVSLPDQFWLINQRDGIAYHSQVVRRQGKELSLTFLQEVPIHSITDPAMLFLKRLWAERAPR